MDAEQADLQPRSYTMRARLDSLAETRHKITQATMSLHERVGPRHTTVSAIAAAAGVTRVTVYRHFPDEAALVTACSQHWATLHPAPEVSDWLLVADPVARLRTALLETYGWARAAAPMMTMIHRDLDVMPEFVAGYLAQDERDRVSALVEPFSAQGPALQQLTAVIAHALDVRTWESLCLRGGLADTAAVEAMAAAALAVAREA